MDDLHISFAAGKSLSARSGVGQRSWRIRRLVASASIAACSLFCATTVLAGTGKLVLTAAPLPTSAAYGQNVGFSIKLDNTKNTNGVSNVWFKAQSSVDSGVSGPANFIKSSLPRTASGGDPCTPDASTDQTVITCLVGAIAAKKSLTFGLVFSGPASGLADQNVHLSATVPHGQGPGGNDPSTSETALVEVAKMPLYTAMNSEAQSKNSGFLITNAGVATLGTGDAVYATTNVDITADAPVVVVQEVVGACSNKYSKCYVSTLTIKEVDGVTTKQFDPPITSTLIRAAATLKTGFRLSDAVIKYKADGEANYKAIPKCTDVVVGPEPLAARCVTSTIESNGDLKHVVKERDNGSRIW